LQNWKKNGAKFRQTRGQTKNGIFAMTFTYQCVVCKKDQAGKIRARKHLETHTKKELINSVKNYGWYDHE